MINQNNIYQAYSGRFEMDVDAINVGYLNNPYNVLDGARLADMFKQPEEVDAGQGK